jgi:MFS family permease
MAGLLTASIASGQLISRRGRYKIFPVVGSAVLTGGLLLLSRLGPHTTLPVASVYMFVVGLGIGLVMQVLVVAVQNAVPYSRLGVATSTATFFRTIGGAFGVSILGAVFNNRVISEVSKAHLPAAALRSIVSGSNIIVNPAKIDNLPPAIRAPLVAAFGHSLQTVFLVAVPFAVLAFALGWLMKEIPLRTTAFSPTSPDSNGTGKDTGDPSAEDVAVEVVTL